MKIIYSSNLTTKEHISILKKETENGFPTNYKLLSKSFYGLKTKDFFLGFPSEIPSKNRLKVFLTIDHSVFKDIIFDLYDSSFHKEYLFQIKNNQITVSNIYKYYKSYNCNNNTNINFTVKSKSLKNLRLNKKTFTKKVTTLLTDKGIAFLFYKNSQSYLVINKIDIKQC